MNLLLSYREINCYQLGKMTRKLKGGPGTEPCIRRFIDGDSSAFERFHSMYDKQLYLQAYKYTKSRFIADEIVQEVFIKLWSNRKKIQPGRNIEAYLYSMVRNQALNYIRDTIKHEDLSAELWKDVLRAGEQSDHEIISKEYNGILDKILEQVPAQRRSIYLLSRKKGLSNREIANQLGIAKATVENQLWKTLQFIKKHLEPHIDITLTILVLLSAFVKP